MNIETYPPEETAQVMAAAPPSPHGQQAPPPPPATNTVPPPPPMPPAPVKQRRVGTFTLGITLILLGILVPLSLVFGGDMWRLMQFAPLVLLVLGVEILVFAIRFKSEKFRYDGVSVFLVVLITFVTLIGSLVTPPIANAVEYANEESAVCREARMALEEELAATNSSGYVSVYNTESSGWEYVAGKTPEKEDWRLTVQVRFGEVDGQIAPDLETVSRVFASTAAAAGEQDTIRDLHMECTVTSPEGVTTYQARLVGSLLHTVTTDNMENWIQVDFEAARTQPAWNPTTPASTAAAGS